MWSGQASGLVTTLAVPKVAMGGSDTLAGVRREWVRRIEAEYTSAAHTHHLTLWLIQLGFPRELIDDGLAIVKDELDHATLSAEVARAAGGGVAPVLVAERLALPRLRSDLREDALLATVELFCLGETVAVPLFKELRSECSEAVAKDALDRILRDEVRHRAFGWDCLDYFLEQTPALQSLVCEALPALFAKILRLYGRVPLAEIAIDPVERAWGLMPRALYRAILLEVVESEYTPRFAELGIEIQAAWRSALAAEER
jgi:hypothetical protein